MNLTQEIRNERLSAGNSYFRPEKSAYCPICEKPATLVTFVEAGALMRSAEAEIENLANAGVLHRLQNRKGEVMVCGDSLFTCYESRQTRLLPRLDQPA